MVLGLRIGETMKTTALVMVAALALGACTDGLDDELGAEQQQSSCAGCGGGGGTGGSSSKDIETQGRHLFGASIDGVLPAPTGKLFSVKLTGLSGATGPGAPMTIAFSGDASIAIGSASGPPLSGAVRLAPTTGAGSLLVQFSRTATIGASTVSYYALSWSPTGTSGTYAPLCDGAEAVPVFYEFTTAGLHAHPTGGAPLDRISFACADGVEQKCVNWGYPSGGTYDPSPASDWQVNQACTRMARADYCATGTPHTMEGTSIEIFDEVGVHSPPPDTFLGVASWPPPVADFYFEAGWRGDDQPAACLSKLRWQAMPIGGPCGNGNLPDPRVDSSAQTCDEMIMYYGKIGTGDGQTALATFAQANDVVLFDASKYNDVAMNPWKSGTDRVLSIDGYLDDNLIKRPYTTSYDPAPVAVDGLLMRSAPTSVIVGTDAETMSLYKNAANDRVYVTDSFAGLLPTGYTQVATKGYVYTESYAAVPHDGLTLVPMYLYEKPANGDHTTSTSTNPPGTGYNSLGVIGYVAQPEPPEPPPAP